MSLLRLNPKGFQQIYITTFPTPPSQSPPSKLARSLLLDGSEERRDFWE